MNALTGCTTSVSTGTSAHRQASYHLAFSRIASAAAGAWFGPRTSGRGVMSIEQRSRERRKRIVVHRAEDYEDAERWDLEFWQAMTPQERLSALVAIRRDVEKVRAARRRPDRC